VRIIDKYKTRNFHPVYHILVDNPYETKEAKKENIDFVTSLSQGTTVHVIPLVFFPGTELYEKAKKDGLIKNEIDEIYLKSMFLRGIRKLDYLTSILCLSTALKRKDMSTKWPINKIIKFLSKRGMILIFDNKVYETLICLLREITATFKLQKIIKNIVYKI